MDGLAPIVPGPGEGAVPISPGDQRTYAEAISFQGSRARRYRRATRVATTIATVMTALCLTQGYAIVSMLPLVRVVPVFTQLNADGSVDTKVTFSSLPPDKRVAGIEASIWAYVRERESYSFHTRQYAYDVVSAMSSNAVREAYQTWANSPKDPSNPAVTLKDKGTLSLRRVDGAFISHNKDYTAGTYRIVYLRRLQSETQKQPFEQRFIVSVTYVIADSVPVLDRVTINPDGVIVTEYPPPSEDGAARSVGGEG